MNKTLVRAIALSSLAVIAGACSCSDDDPIVSVEAGVDGNIDGAADGGSDGGVTVDPAQQCEPTDSCGILDGSGCATANQCRIFQEEGQELRVECRPEGSTAQGEACDMGNDLECGPGLICYNETCQQYCCFDGDDPNSHNVCPDDAFCLVNYTSDDEASTPSAFGVCVPQTGCDLLQQDCAAEGSGCYLLNRGNTASGYCLEPVLPSKATGEACAANTDCAPGSLCVGEGTCASICDRTNEDACNEGELCNELETAPANVGVCIPSA